MQHQRTPGTSAGSPRRLHLAKFAVHETQSACSETGDSSGTPSPVLDIDAATASVLSGTDRGEMALRFTASGGVSRIDDIFIAWQMKH